jgi:heme/copper-type cytochrome/quinol oxidase subunit 4
LISIKNPEAPIGKLAISAGVVAFVTYFYIGLRLAVRDFAWLGFAYVAFTICLIAYLWVTPKNEPLDFWSEIFSYSAYIFLVGLWLWGSFA